ncbi:MAG: hypothetical protein IPL26_21075 [Leptospiraceae bacterium]|nr:hypothetical protein [Leptospiraceae bacterium]
MKIFLVLMLISLQNIFSETLVLKDSTVIKMTLKSQDVDTLTYTLKGKEYKVPKNKIRRVVYAKTPELEDKIAKEELLKMKQEKASKKPAKTPEEEQEDNRLLNEEIARAIEEQKRQELLNLSFEERIKRLEQEVSNLNIAAGGNAVTKISEIEKEIADLKTRTRRIERFLEIDEDIEDYYSKPRSMWSIVWRSALVPGWGLSYGREGVFSSIYSPLFFVSLLGGAGFKASTKSLDKALDDKFLNDFIIQPIVTSTLASSPTYTSVNPTIVTDVNNIQNSSSSIKLFKYLQSRETYESQVANSEKLFTFAIGVYAVQLIHSAIYGYFWAQRTPVKFWEEKNSGWKFQISPLVRKNQVIDTQSYQMELGYRFQF